MDPRNTPTVEVERQIRAAQRRLDREVAETAERMSPAASVALTVGAWASLIGYGLLLGVVAFVAVTL